MMKDGRDKKEDLEKCRAVHVHKQNYCVVMVGMGGKGGGGGGGATNF